MSGSLNRPFATAEIRDEPLNWLVTSCLMRQFRKLTRIADKSRFDNSSCHIITNNTWLVIAMISSLVFIILSQLVNLLMRQPRNYYANKIMRII